MKGEQPSSKQLSLTEAMRAAIVCIERRQPKSAQATLEVALQQLAAEPSAMRDALEAIASPGHDGDYGWWTQVARRALGYAAEREIEVLDQRAAQPPTEKQP